MYDSIGFTSLYICASAYGVLVETRGMDES